MGKSELETVLSNWICQAFSPTGSLPSGTDQASWVTARFAEWWKERAECAIADAEKAASAIEAELIRVGGWERFGEALHEHIHLQDALSELREALGLSIDEVENQGG